MKILIIRNYPSFMDVIHNTYNIQEVGLAKALTRKGHKADIVFWTDKEEKEEKIEFDEGQYITVFYKRGKNILKNAWFKDIDDLISEYDVIQACEYNQIQSWYWAKKYQNKMIIYHGPYYSSFNARYNLICKVFDMFFLKRYIKLKTKFIVKSKLAAEFLISKGIEGENISAIGVGIDTQLLDISDNYTSEFIEEMKNNTKDLKLLYIGKIEKRRDPNFLIDVLKSMIDRGVNVHLYVIGDGKENDTSDFQKYINTNDIKENITWIRKCEQKYLANVYKSSDVFLLPTKYEIFGMVLLEAMYYGCVVYTTINGGSSMLITNGVSGYILNTDNKEDWISKILNIHNNKILQKNIKENATNKIKKEFTWDALADKFINRYESIINKKQL